MTGQVRPSRCECLNITTNRNSIRQDICDLDENSAEAEFYHQRSISLIILKAQH